MLYNLSRDIELQRFDIAAGHLRELGAVVELKRKAKRTLSQNNYLHLIIGVVAMETGNTLAYAKEVYFKRLANKAIFVAHKADELAGDTEYLRSSASLSTEEMSIAIDKFKMWAAENGIYLPEPGDKERLQEIAIEIERNRKYL